ncbi:hypothetical protein [Nonomuraea recticatena]|uniref:hypothetical protein n=1 Tax=Nonomuraea recticatena TaxID=46178 RepID=UPI003609108C
MDHDAFLSLLTPRGQRALAEAVELMGADPVVAATRMRRTHDADLTSAALTQATLRQRAVAKFGDDAASMYFTLTASSRPPAARSPSTAPPASVQGSASSTCAAASAAT